MQFLCVPGGMRSKSWYNVRSEALSLPTIIIGRWARKDAERLHMHAKRKLQLFSQSLGWCQSDNRLLSRGVSCIEHEAAGRAWGRLYRGMFSIRTLNFTRSQL
jgi:hypothetical protein